MTQIYIINASSQRDGETCGFQERVDDCDVNADLGEGVGPLAVGSGVTWNEGYVKRAELGQAVDDVFWFPENH